MKKKLQIFVSSTYIDLKEERQAAVEAILKSGNIPAGMELFTSGNESQLDTIKRWIDESDIFLLILGGRYGSIEPKSNKSYTELEYDYAKTKEKPTFAVVIDEKFLEQKVHDNSTEFIEREHTKELNLFRDKVLSNISSFFTSTNDIKLAIHETLADFKERYEFTGWIPGNSDKKVSKLVEENSKLKDRIMQLEQSNSNLNTTYNIPNLSEMTDYYSFNCMYYEEDHTELKNEVMNFTWNDLFSAIAPWVLDDPEDNIAKTSLIKLCKNFLIKKYNVQIKIEDIFIVNENVKQIKIQFMAYGLIDESGYSWDLTDKGRQLMILLKAQRKNK